MNKKNMKNKKALYVLLLLLTALLFTSCKLKADDYGFTKGMNVVFSKLFEGTEIKDIADIPPYKDRPYVEINKNKPNFSEEDFKRGSFETYAKLDYLGRCGQAFAKIEKSVMPTGKRREIGMIKPSGWQTTRYKSIADGSYLYNRCHLIAYMLAGENANKNNLITGTRYFNIEGMLPFEKKVADYVNNEKGAVLYRVTPIFKDDNLVAGGVLMEAASVEDRGKSLSFNVYVYNVQPGIEIDYKNGNSSLAAGSEEGLNAGTAADKSMQKLAYVLNTKTNKFHKPECSSIKKIRKENKLNTHITRDELLKEGYEPCKICNP